MCTKATSVIWKVRVVKRYPEAHNHLLIGKVLAKDGVCIELDCRSFHFGRLINSLKDVQAGESGRRIIPWSHIEIINVLPDDFDYREAELSLDREGNILLKDRRYACPIATRSEPRH